MGKQVRNFTKYESIKSSKQGTGYRTGEKEKEKRNKTQLLTVCSRHTPESMGQGHWKGRGGRDLSTALRRELRWLHQHLGSHSRPGCKRKRQTLPSNGERKLYTNYKHAWVCRAPLGLRKGWQNWEAEVGIWKIIEASTTHFWYWECDRQKTRKDMLRAEQHPKLTSPHRHLENTTSNCRTHILIKHTHDTQTTKSALINLIIQWGDTEN